MVNGKRDKHQQEVEENGDEGQGQTDCPGAIAHTTHHPTERRVRRGEHMTGRKEKDVVQKTFKNMLGEYEKSLMV